MSSPEAPQSVESESPEQDVRSSNGQTFVQAPEVPHSVVSESQEEHVRLSSGQISLQAVEVQEIQTSSVQASRITSTTQCTSSLSQTIMSPGIQVSQTLQQISHYTEPSTSSKIQPLYRYQQPQTQHPPPPPPLHQQPRNNKQLLNEPLTPGTYVEDPPEMYPGSPAPGPSQPLDLSHQTYHTEQSTSTHTTHSSEYQLILSENVARNVTCRLLTEETVFQAPPQTTQLLLSKPLIPLQPSTSAIHNVQTTGLEQNEQNEPLPQLSTQSLSETQPGMSHTNRGILCNKICICTYQRYN